MQAGEPPTEILQLRHTDALVTHQTVELFTPVEGPHDHRIFHRRAVPIYSGPGAMTRDGTDFQVKSGSKAPIESQLLLAEMTPIIQLAEVGEGVDHRSLDLVGALAGEQHPRQLGFDDLDRDHGVRVRARAQQTL